MLEHNTQTPVLSQTSDYGPFHIDLSPTKQSQILAEARAAHAHWWREIGKEIGVAVSHRLHGALLDTGRFLHAHNVLRGGSH